MRIRIPIRPRAGLFVVLVVAATLLGACRKETGLPEGRTPPNPSAPARYGPPKGGGSASVSRARPVGFHPTNWQAAPFCVVETELSPATLIHSTNRYLGLFTGLTKYGLGAPTHVAWSTISGPRSFKNGESLDVANMEENWVLAWFAGARGWTNWDSPWAVFLQHRPASLKLDAEGLHFTFSNRAGDVVLLPLYGSYKPPLQGFDLLEQNGLPGKEIKTWEWAAGLPRDPLVRLRYWAGATRRFPIYCEDSFSVDRSADSVTIRSRFEWHAIEDDWRTKPLKVAPLSPALALAAKEPGFPVEFSAKPFDLHMGTPYGPYMGVPNVDAFDATFSVLQYINETESVVLPDTNASAVVAASLERVRSVGREKFKTADHESYLQGGLSNFCRAIQGDIWSARALPYFDTSTRSNALAALRRSFANEVLVTNRFQRREYPKGSGRDYWVLGGPDIASGTGLGDAGKLSANLLKAVFAYAHFSGDWELIRERWPFIKRLMTTGAETRWAGFGRDAVDEIGDEAAPCLAFARLAYQAGDIDSYHYGCYLFARELVHLWAKQRGADYFRKNQPVHSMEFMDEDVYLTRLGSDTAGWQIDGPRYPASAGERRFQQRWVRFDDWDVGRFYQDYLGADIRWELEALTRAWEPERRHHNDPHLAPSLVQLRSLLLNEPPDSLAAIATPDQFTGPPSGILASAISVIRTSRPTRFERLIPPGDPTPFVAGLEREVAGPNSRMSTAVFVAAGVDENGPHHWPAPGWSGWMTPSGDPWRFGEIRPVRSGRPGAVSVVPLNWNTRILLFGPP